MKKLNDIIIKLEQFCPLDKVCMADYVGLSVGDSGADISNVLVSLDCSMRAIDEAIENNCQLIITHHPLIFGSIASLDYSSILTQKIVKLIKNNIAVYSMHTNLDCMDGGINDYVCSLLKIKDTQPLITLPSGVKVGRYGNIDKVMLSDLAKIVGEKLSDKSVIYYGKDRAIEKVAIINGAGADNDSISLVKEKGIECFITAEIKHHIIIDGLDSDLALVQFSHYKSENVYMTKLVEKLVEIFSGYGVKVFLSKEQ